MYLWHYCSSQGTHPLRLDPDIDIYNAFLGSDARSPERSTPLNKVSSNAFKEELIVDARVRAAGQKAPE